MIKKIFIITLGLAFAINASSFMKDDDEKKSKRGGADGTEEEEGDTTDLFDKNLETEDTLVFEDWDKPGEDEKGTAQDQSLGGSSGEGNGTQGSYGANEVVSFFKDYQEQRYDVNFKVYPNPAVSTLYISFDNAPQTVRVYSMTGTLMYENSSVMEVDVSTYAPGTYIVQLVYPDHVETAKFLKKS